jgi:type I restriction enzyme, S subunit
VITREIAEATFPTKRLGEIADFLDSKRKPVKETDRKSGIYPYYGANGQQGTIDDFIFDEPLILLAEDGGFFDEPDRGIAYRISGKS